MAEHPRHYYVGCLQESQHVTVLVGLKRQGVVLGPYFVEGEFDTTDYIRVIHYNVIRRELPEHKLDRNSL